MKLIEFMNVSFRLGNPFSTEVDAGKTFLLYQERLTSLITVIGNFNKTINPVIAHISRLSQYDNLCFIARREPGHIICHKLKH